MASEPLLVFANGVAVQPKTLLLGRATLGKSKAIALNAKPLAPDAATLGCPISTSGTLNTREVYRDAAVTARGYQLPLYALAVVDATEAPHKRYDAHLELTPNDARVGRLRVRLQGTLHGLPPAKTQTELRFATLPDGRSVTAPIVLKGNEFPGLRVAGAPVGSYCADARAAAVLPAGKYINDVAALTSAAPDDPLKCNTVPLEFVFAEPVHAVKILFSGAAVAYTLRALDAHGTQLAEDTQGVPAYVHGSEHALAVTAPGDAIARVVFGNASRGVNLVHALITERTAAATGPTELQALPHQVSLGLTFLVREGGTGPDRVATTKQLGFDEVLQRDNQTIEATLWLRTLPEFDAVYQAMTDAQAACRLVVQCEADVAVKQAEQVYIAKPADRAVSGDRRPLNVALREARTPARTLNVATVLRASVHRVSVVANRRVLEPAVTRSAEATQPAAPTPRSEPAILLRHRVEPARFSALVRPEVLAAAVQPSAVSPGATQPGAATPTAAPPSAASTPEPSTPAPPQPTTPRRGDRVRIKKDVRPLRFFADARGEPAYARAHVSLQQRVPFFLDRALHGYLYPPEPPGSGAQLVRYAVAQDQVIFQDALERHVFYYLPDEFRLTRDETRSPTYKPSLQVAFYALAGNDDDTDDGDEDAADTLAYRVQLTFRAVPYLKPERLADALGYITDKQLIPNGLPASLLPLAPAWSQLSLVLPKEGGGSETTPRPDATLLFDKHVIDSLTLSSSEFAEVFQSMRVGGTTMNGQVRYRLPGSAVEQAVPLWGELSKLVGPVLAVELVGPAETAGRYRLRVENGIESPVRLTQALFTLAADPELRQWVVAVPVAGTWPLELAAGERRELEVTPQVALGQAFAARLRPSELTVALDFEALWRSVLETPGWDDLVQPVAVDIDGSYFTGPSALDHVEVCFNRGEAQVTLNRAQLKAEVKLVRPILPFLLGLDTADDYFYRVTSWRRPSPAAEPVKMAESPWQTHEGPALTVTPPVG